MRAYVSVYECSFYRETFFLGVASSCSSEHIQQLATVIMAALTTIRIPVADTVEATHGLAGTEMMDLYPTTNKVIGALFKWNLSIMRAVNSSTCKTLK